MLAAGQGGCNLSGLGLSSQAWGENNGGSLAPATPRGRCCCSFLFPQACSFVCVCIGGSGEFFCLLLFLSFFFFGLPFG